MKRRRRSLPIYHYYEEDLLVAADMERGRKGKKERERLMGMEKTQKENFFFLVSFFLKTERKKEREE